MIIVLVVLFWFSTLLGMEKKTPASKALSSVPSLKEIALRSVCGYLVDKKISVDQVRQKLPTDIIKLIEDSEECFLEYENKDIESYFLRTITPDHRYMLARGALGIVRLDLITNETITAADSTILALEESSDFRLSPRLVQGSLSLSGNLAVFVAPHKWWVKDITQNKIIIEQQEIEEGFNKNITFIGEKDLLISDFKNRVREYEWAIWSIEKRLKKRISCKYTWVVATLPATEEYIGYVYAKEAFLRVTFEGTIKNQTQVKNLEQVFTRAFYEPAMLIAYKCIQYVNEEKEYEEYIEIVSLKDWPAVAIPSARLQCYMLLTTLAFAHKGQWLIAGGSDFFALEARRKTEDGKMIIWDWQRNQQLYTYEKRYIYENISDDMFISSTDRLTPHPGLFQTRNGLYSFDPIKVVAATMLSQATLQSPTSASNDNNSNNNNNSVSNDNGPTTAMERDK